MGKLIVIDGLDGSGKRTQCNRLAKYLTAKGKNVRLLDFPCYGTPGCVLVEKYLSGELGKDPEDTNAYAASLFFGLDRYYSFRTDWGNALADENTVLIADRYTTANAVHQTAKLAHGEWDGYLGWLFDTEFVKLGLPRPDSVIYLEVLPEVSIGLVRARSVSENRKMDIHELDEGFYHKSYEAAVYASEKFGWNRIKCCENGVILPQEVIFAKIVDALGI